MMSSPHPSLRDLFDAARDLAPEQRVIYLEANCADPQIRARVARMLATDPKTDAALPNADALVQAIGESEISENFVPGRHIGQFELLGVLGEGGSSSVFRAARNVGDMRQEVALKLLHRSLHSAQARSQFRRERQALTQLQHPGIARLVDGGVTPNGLAYIALDLIEGEPITVFAQRHKLGLDERLELFLQVCRAVEAAHRALIVHRDLKPSNVLVTHDSRVKLLDFGIAKLLDSDDDTQTHLASFTPAYAAPEQRSGAPITTATDVFALGVLLGELITGRRLNDGSGRTPSARIDEPTESDTVQSSPQILGRQLRGDLDNIVMKALAAEPEDRYASAGAFADEIERYRAGRPVAAHPPSRWYRARKFVQRHRGGVIITCSLLLGVFAALGVAVWQASIARAEAQRANAVRKFLMEVFDAAKMELPSNERPTPETLVKEAGRRAREDASINPALRADLLQTLGTVTLTMGDYAQAETLLDDALQRQDQAGVAAGAPQRLETLIQKGNLLLRTDRSAEADAMMSRALPEMRKLQSDVTVEGLTLFATTRLYSGHADEALALAREAAADAARIDPADSLVAIKTASLPGQICVVARRWKDAVAELEPVVQRWRALGVVLDIDFAQAVNNLAVAKDHVGEGADAEALYRENIALRRRIYADRPNDRLGSALEAFAIFLNRHEEFDEAQRLLDEALSIESQVLGGDNLQVASTLDTLGTLENSERRFEASEQHLRAALALYTKHAGAAGELDNDLALTRIHLAQTLLERSSLDEATTQNALGLDALRKRNGGNADLEATTLAQRARISLLRGDAARALAICAESRAVFAGTNPAPRTEVIVGFVCAQALAAQGRHQEAIGEADKAITTLRSALPDAHTRLAALLALRAREEKALGQSDAAAATIAEGRSLGVPATLMSDADAATLNLIER